MRQQSKINLALISFIIVGIALRFWNIGFQATNWDEQFTMEISGPAWNLLPLVIHTLTYDFTPPLYYTAAHFSMLIFGATPEAIRIPAAIAGVFLIPAMYLVGREFRDEIYGLLLAGLTTIFYNFSYYSKYGRTYSMLLLFFSLAFYFFMKALKGDNGAKLWFALFSLCCLWTHLFSVIPIGIMVLYLLYESIFVEDFISYSRYLTIDMHKLAWFGVLCVGCLPLLSYVNLIVFHRVAGVGGDTFGATIPELLVLIPLDIFTYSVFIIFPICVWVLWKHHSERIISFISLLCLGTWGAMLVLSLKTPIILHYALPLTIPFLMVAILPFYEALKEQRLMFHHYVVVMVVIVLEVVQIVALGTIQRVLG